MEIKITNLKTRGEDTVLAIMDAELNDIGITISGIKIINGRYGEFVAMPSIGEKIDGKWKFTAAIILPDELAKDVNRACVLAFREQEGKPSNDVYELSF